MTNLDYPKVELFYIGEKYYEASGSDMSSLYSTDKTRCDWGMVEKFVGSGISVTIRPATTKEIEWANEKLGALLLKNRGRSD